MEKLTEEKAVAILAELTALECGVHSAVAKQIHTVTLLHDVGKQKIAGHILEKPGKLTAEEFEIMKTHTKLGVQILNSIQGSMGKMARIVAMYHHETYDSERSYWGRHSCELPAYIHIVTISDIFMALLHTRVYKKGWTLAETVEYINSHSGTLFNPALVQVFLPLVRRDARLKTLFASIS